MKTLMTLAAVLLMQPLAAQNAQTPLAGNESASLTYIADLPSPTSQPKRLFPDVPDSLWNALGLQDGVPSGINTFVLQTEGKNILFDTGLGAPTSQLLTKLSEMGIAPETVSHIYITHLHGDHIGGLLKDGKAVFPRAGLYVNRVEAEAWQNMSGDRSATAKRVLDVYKERLHLFEAGETLTGNVQAIAAYGHTPGHTVFRKDNLLVIGDLMHGAALQLEHPEFCATYDMDAAAARESRIRLLKYARENKLTMYGMHLPSPGFVK